MRNWYALYTKPHKERQVDDLLRQRGIEVYLPFLHVVKKGRLRATSEPLFPCYLFARLDLKETGLSSISYTQGLRSIVSFCGEPAVVDESVITSVKKHLAEIAGSDVVNKYKRGERVMITEGPFKDWQAVFVGNLSGSHRVRVLLSVLGGATPCEVDIAWLKKAT